MRVRRLRRITRRTLLRGLRVAVLVAFSAVAVTAALVLGLRWIDPPTSAFMVTARLAAGAEGRAPTIDHRWLPLERIAPAVALAVIAAEDQRFTRHWGFDLESIADALGEHERGGRLRGASTITQQTAKNLFLWQGRSWLRKALEAYFTLLIELCWPKSRILEVYLNLAEFGAGTYGVGAAAERFFGKPAALLDWRESALLASVLPSPRRMSPARPSPYVERRSRWILDQMRYVQSPV